MDVQSNIIICMYYSIKQFAKYPQNLINILRSFNIFFVVHLKVISYNQYGVSCISLNSSYSIDEQNYMFTQVVCWYTSKTLVIVIQNNYDLFGREKNGRVLNQTNHSLNIQLSSKFYGFCGTFVGYLIPLNGNNLDSNTTNIYHECVD